MNELMVVSRSVSTRVGAKRIVSETIDAGSPESGGWTESQAYPGLRLRFEKARGRRCDRCWKVTPEAEADGICARCRRALESLAAEPAGVAR